MLAVRKFLLPTLALLLFVPIFLALGFWQLDRAAEKRALQAEYDRRATQPPIELGGRIRSARELQFSRVQAQGNYENEYQVLWDNRIHHGMAGFHVITPFRLADGKTRVLVNRGWVPMGSDRDHLPEIAPPQGTVTISGIAVVPRHEFSLGALDTLKRDGITVWQQIDLARFAKEVGWPLEPIVVLLDPKSPGGYVRDWARLDTGVAVHEGYAFQWFLLAGTALVLYVVLMARALRRIRTAAGDGSQ